MRSYSSRLHGGAGGNGQTHLIDFGRELYVPWQIRQGRVLYRDIASLFGPLSSYVNASWFRLFGVSLLTLAICNMAVFAPTISGLHRLVRLSTDRLTANAASLIALLLFWIQSISRHPKLHSFSPTLMKQLTAWH